MGGGSGVVLPGMALRGREDDYGGGRGMGPNGQAMEPLNKRPRCVCVCFCSECASRGAVHGVVLSPRGFGGEATACCRCCRQ